ncbi:MAG: hypothetical protein AB1772_07910 [Candidatus Zixiibacteriota bacterium]
MFQVFAERPALGAFLASLLVLATLEAAETPRSVVIENQEQALNRALKYAGFANSKGFVRPSAASCVTETAFADSTTPFLSDSIAGPKRWIVTFDSVFLDFGGWSSETVSNQIRKTYNFVLDPPTGRLLKVYSTYEGPDSALLPEPPTDSSTVRLSRNERHVSLVESVPFVSFYQALDAAVPTNPLQAKEIQAWLVMFSHHGAQPVPCWIILARGTIPFPKPSAPSLSPATQESRLSSTSIRCIINATSGKWLFCEG